MPTRFVRDFSSIAGVAPQGSRVAVPATLAPTVRLALSSGNPIIPTPPGGPTPGEQLIPIAASNGPLEGSINLPAGAQSMIQLGSSSMFVPGDYSGSLPSSSGAQGSAIIDLIGKGIGLAGSILSRNNVQTNQLPPPSIGGMIGRGGSGTLDPDTLRLLGIPQSAGKDTVLTKEGKPRRVKKNGQPYARPHMNPLNARALRRSMSRVQRFAKIAKKTISFTHRVRMKKRRRS